MTLELSFTASHLEWLVPRWPPRSPHACVPWWLGTRVKCLMFFVRSTQVTLLRLSCWRNSLVWWSLRISVPCYCCFVIIIIIIDLITLLVGVCVLGNFHLSKTVGGFGFSHGKEIHHIPKGQGLYRWEFAHSMTRLYSIFFATPSKIFSVKRVFCRYFRKFLVTTLSAEMTKGYT
jgi:hypothetical protein